MNGVKRLESGGEIDRTKPVAFTFDDRPFWGYAGDTIASALLANGVSTVTRSFKYHRPRGVFSAGIEEPNAIVDLRQGTHHDPNARATVVPLGDSMFIRSIHALGTADRDRLGFLDRLHRFMPAAFYYKTFFWPSWRLYEGAIRRLAGLGRLDFKERELSGNHQFVTVDLCIIGAGPAGIAAALAGARSGRKILLLDEQTRIGGGLLSRRCEIGKDSSAAWLEAASIELAASGVIIRTRTTAIGIYDDNEVVAIEHLERSYEYPNGERMWRIRAAKTIIAAGAIERPMLFGNNDLPGIMLAGAGLAYLRRYALRLGEDVIVTTTNDSSYELAGALRQAGARVTVLDNRSDARPMSEASANGISVRPGVSVEAAFRSDNRLSIQTSDGGAITADFVFASGGWTPSIHLYCHARGKPRWEPAIGAFVPGGGIDGLIVIGAANGTFDLTAALAEGHLSAGGAPGQAPRANTPARDWSNASVLLPKKAELRVWVDLQADVTVGDIELAARENFASVEHLKRYTTLGMANDQGKTSNFNGLAALARATGAEVAALGLTTYRPPYAPVSMASIAGRNRGQLHTPVRRLAIENIHRAEGAYFREYGGILRPAWYGPNADAIGNECLRARTDAIVFDASSLGKIEVIGPDASALLDFVFYNRMSTLELSRLRYGLLLTEGGVIFDDGIVLRLSADSFVISCSSSHVPSVVAHLEEWRQDRFDKRRVFVHDATAHWATITIAGPQARHVLKGLDLGIDADDTVLPHMSMKFGTFNGKPARVARVSFIGERCYEVSVPSSVAGGFWQKARSSGARPLGVEALSILRVEKGYIVVGQDTDGETMPHDIAMNGPREKRTDAYVGDRSLFTPAALRAGRRQLVGIAVDGERVLPAGAQAVEETATGKRSLGFVTSGYFSHTLGHPIALALIEEGRRRLGEVMRFEYLGRRLTGKVVQPCFLDSDGARIHA